MNGSITNRQMFFFLFLTLTTYTVISIPKVIAQGPGTGGWISILAASLLFAGFAALIVRLNSSFPGMMLYEYSEKIVGKFFAVVFAVYFILYFLLVLMYLNAQLSAVLKAEFYPETPQWVMLIASVIVFGSIAYRGVRNVARFFEMIGITVLIAGTITNAIMTNQGNVHEILPLFRASKWEAYLFGIKDVILAFLGVEILTIVPMSGKGIGRSVMTAILSVLFIGLFYVYTVDACFMMLGFHSVQNYNFTLIEGIKLIANSVVERFDMLYLTMGFAGLVAGISAVYLALVEYVSKLLPKINRLSIVIGAGVVIVGLGILAQAIYSSCDMMWHVLPYAGLVTSFVIPLVLFLIMKVKGIGKKAS